jgi:hypothetical protein
MVERICPRCESANLATHARCAQCGAALEQSLALRPSHALSKRVPRLPAQWKQHGRIVALGVATLAAQIAVDLLNRRQQHIVPLRPAPQTTQTARVVALGQRVSETWRDGQLQQRVVEQVVWLAPGESER